VQLDHVSDPLIPCLNKLAFEKVIRKKIIVFFLISKNKWLRINKKSSGGLDGVKDS